MRIPVPDRAGALCAAGAAAVLSAVLSASPALAYEHHESRVNFEEYAPDVIERARGRQRPFFLLFSAEWCYWCHEFAERSLAREEVYTYLNEHFVNVFVDADIHTGAYARYRATGVPYIVFLRPNGTVHFKYTGTVYADQFADVLHDIRKTIEQGITIPGQADAPEPYDPPRSLEIPNLLALSQLFSEGIVESFDAEEHGVGRGKKAILPRTFLYLLAHAEDEDRDAVVAGVGGTVDRAIDAIYDPVEGGFFRYAETRDWRIPHYEKMADLNAGAVLVLHALGERSPTAVRTGAGARTTEYLRSTLYEAGRGTFLSFQGADTRYFRLDAAGRKHRPAPVIADKVFTDRLAATLDHLIDILPHAADRTLERQVERSLDFLAAVVEERGHPRRYHVLSDGTWQGDSLPRDYALVARVFQKAARRFSEPRYARLGHRVVESALDRFHDPDRGIFVDPSLAGDGGTEHLMETNALLALAMMGLDEDGIAQRWDVVESLMTYFSGVGELLDERLWESSDWEIMEAYVPYLEAIDVFLALRSERG